MPTPEFVLALREKVGTAPLWLSGVTAVVLRGDEILLVRRADNGAWTPITGIIDPGEEPAVAAVREVAEEAAVQVTAERLVMVHVTGPVVYSNGDRSQYLDLVFRLGWDGGEPAPAEEHRGEVVPRGRDAAPLGRHATAHPGGDRQPARGPLRATGPQPLRNDQPVSCAVQHRREEAG